MADSVIVFPGAACWRPPSASVSMAAARSDRPTAGGAAPPAQVPRAAGRRVSQAVIASVRLRVDQEPLSFCFGRKRRPLTSFGFFDRRRTQKLN